MMTMYLNNKTDEPIDVSQFTRAVDVDDPTIIFHIDFNFVGDYSPENMQYLSQYADQKITSIEIRDIEQDIIYLIDVNLNAVLVAANELCNDRERVGHGEITVYTPETNEE